MDTVYKEIFDAAEDMSCDKLEAIFEKMEMYRIPEAEKDIFAKIKAASDGYDYDKIVDFLSDRYGEEE
jgi:hypothetical protein